MGIIYKITNSINNKEYVGQTTRPLNARWKEHKTGNYHRQVIDTAIKKYGKENFSIEILEECPNELLDDREQYWIAYYDTYYNGYNNTKGGQIYQSTCLSDEEIKRILQEWKNTDLCLTHFCKYIKHSVETVKNYLLQNGVTQEEINIRKYNQTFPNRKIKSKSKNKKLRLNKKEKEEKNKEEEKSILFDFSEGHSLTFLAKKYHKTNTTIRNLLAKNNISSQEIENHKFYDRTLNKWKIIYCYDLQGNLLKEYPTRESLLNEYSIKDLKLIHNCCSGLKKTSLGKKWSYIPIVFTEKDIKQKRKKCEKYDEANNLIYVYDSIQECSEKNNISLYKINNSSKNNIYYNNFRYKIVS